MDYNKLKKEIGELISSLVSQAKFHVNDPPQQSRNYTPEIVALPESRGYDFLLDIVCAEVG